MTTEYTHANRLKAQKNRIAVRPFWQADKPYLHNQNISDARFRLLGYVMALLAGGINAGGFFAVAAYTSHVSGSVSLAADSVFVGDWQAAAAALTAVLFFVLGATHASWTILWAKRQRFRSSYGLSMWLEAVYLLLFGLLGVALSRIGSAMVQPTVWFLCFIMGMHNTVMTVLSGGAIRSTHMTGTATDLGIELSKVLYYRRSDNPRLPEVRVNRPKIKLFSGMMTAFFCGGVLGAWGYHTTGYHFTLPMSLLLFVFGAGSVGYDVRIRSKWLVRRRFLKRRRKI